MPEGTAPNLSAAQAWVVGGLANGTSSNGTASARVGTRL
ncbi:hypothetical protein QBA35_36105 [Streptomyces bottropensis]|uniref:Uncharacterized protein n=1 Tax=Streptomyces bottropensis TaxID=42235 RepID=A0ABU8AY88_9ACTN